MQFLKESMLELIIQTSTNLPPDVRKAMAWALRTENPQAQAGQALAIIGENIDMAHEDEGAICQDTGMPTFEIKTPVGVNQIAHAQTDSGSRGGGHQARQAAAQFRGLDHRQEQRRQSGSRHAHLPFRAVGKARGGGAPDSQGRGLREQEHPVFRALPA